jgi:hydroxymethylglutaryl-CoA reductase (NADPH)
MSATAPPGRVGVPRDRENDCTRDAAARRREFLAERAGASLEHVSSYSFDPGVLPGNVEHAQGEFYVPPATAEGTLVASYNRGMKLLHEVDGVTVTVVDERMRRAPAFVFGSARDRGRDGPLRRAVARLGDRRRGVGVRP